MLRHSTLSFISPIVINANVKMNSSSAHLFPLLLYPAPRMAVAVRCADYTDSPTTNMLPGDVNMAKLREMYLTRRLTRVEEDGTVVETTQLIRR